MRNDEESDEKGVLEMLVQGSRRRGRPKRRWEDYIRLDIFEKGLNTNLSGDRGRNSK